MKKTYMFIIFMVVNIIAVISISAVSLAHQGSTDSQGGHHDYKNKSGLGDYHYHCGGYPPHLHPGGHCEYTEESYDESYGDNSYNAGDNDDLYEIRSVDVKKVTIQKIKKSMYVGEIYKFKAKIEPNNADDTELYWSSSDEEVASVDYDDGTVEALSPGEVVITAEASNGVKNNIRVNVKEVVAKKITVEYDEKLFYGESFKPIVHVEPFNTTYDDIRLESSDDNIAVIINDEVFGNNVGTATINVIQKDVSTSFDVMIVPKEVEGLKIILCRDDKVCMRDQITASVDIVPEDATYKDVVWKSSDAKVATIDEDGCITAKFIGTTYITAYAKNGCKDIYKLQVYPSSVEWTALVLSVISVIVLIIYFIIRKSKLKSKKSIKQYNAEVVNE